MFRKVLIANRGEIAVRIIRTLREMGIGSIAAFSEADRHALFVHEADEAFYLGPAPAAESYLNVAALLAVAQQAGADAVHPGYGFLAENADFAQSVADAGMVFIGPSPQAMRVMGDKVRARQAVAALGVPVVPGTDGPVGTVRDALRFAEEAGYPVAVKASGGGGGRGIRVVTDAAQMESALEAARREATAYFKNPEVYLERYFHDPRHIEIQVLGDSHGKLVHLGERDCSVQRRHQKLIEESPSPAVDRALRGRIGEAALLAARSAEYTSAGTVEFLLTREGTFYFLEMNTRVQVEHPVTEAVTGVDLIREMITIAAGRPMSVQGSVVEPVGHAIEVRINAENPQDDFRPAPTTVSAYLPPGGPGVRVDGGVYAGYTIPPDYDSLIAKLIVWAPDREAARQRALRALAEYRIGGPSTTIRFAANVLRHPTFAAGDVGTTFVGEYLNDLIAYTSAGSVGPAETAASPAGSRGDSRTFEVEVNRKLFTVRVAEVGGATGKNEPARPRTARKRAAGSDGTAVRSPMHGTVIAVHAAPGQVVAEGDLLFVLEAMKMENNVAAHRAGTLRAVLAAVGDTVESDQPLAEIE